MSTSKKHQLIISKKKKEQSLTRKQRMEERFKRVCLKEIERYFIFNANPNFLGNRIEASIRLNRISSDSGWHFPGRDRNNVIGTSVSFANEFLGSSEKEFYKTFGHTIKETVRKVIDFSFIWSDIAQGRLSFKEILGLENIEQRMAALKLYGIDRIIEETKAELVDKSKRGNELYRIEKIFDRPAYFLKYKDISTDRVYFSGIDPAIFEGKPKREITADRAMAWKFTWTLNMYNQLKIES